MKCIFLFQQGDSGIDCLLEIATIMKESDISPFEVIHSGLIKQLLEYLTCISGDVTRDVRIRRFLHVFLSCPVCTTVLNSFFLNCLDLLPVDWQDNFLSHVLKKKNVM